MAANPLLTLVDAITNQPDPGNRFLFPTPEDQTLPRIVTLPNQAVTGIISLSGTLTPNHDHDHLWAIGIRINNTDHPATTDTGIWTTHIPALSLAPSTLYAITVTASCNNKNAWPANSPNYYLNFE